METPGDLTTLKLGKKKEPFTHWGPLPLKADGTSWPPNVMTTELTSLKPCGAIELNSSNLLDFSFGHCTNARTYICQRPDVLYKHITTPTTWPKALEHCESWGGSLASVHSE